MRAEMKITCTVGQLKYSTDFVELTVKQGLDEPLKAGIFGVKTRALCSP